MRDVYLLILMRVTLRWQMNSLFKKFSIMKIYIRVKGEIEPEKELINYNNILKKFT